VNTKTKKKRRCARCPVAQKTHTDSTISSSTDREPPIYPTRLFSALFDFFFLSIFITNGMKKIGQSRIELVCDFHL
jgi:hypothetical protein